MCKAMPLTRQHTVTSVNTGLLLLLLLLTTAAAAAAAVLVLRSVCA
jgi:hypothetical protein